MHELTGSQGLLAHCQSRTTRQRGWQRWNRGCYARYDSAHPGNECRQAFVYRAGNPEDALINHHPDCDTMPGD
jgi:hypothetical protein